MSDNVLIVPVPSLVATLLNRDKAKGSPLTEKEVIKIRDGCPCIAMTRDQLQNLIESRGYEDIDPERVWEEWSKVRPTFYGKKRKKK